jgi:hypothetical protein
VIAAHGYNLEMTEDAVELYGSDAMSAPQVVDQLINVCRIKERKGQMALVNKLRALALKMYIVINGEPSGFEARYGRAREH